MSENKILSLEKIGYLKTLPKKADINDYESLVITKKNGEKITLYRLSVDRKEFDDTSNFSTSWDLFNSYLNQ
ncbi:MAG: hypothetical protein VX689_03255 [Bacteroidota bacterium]|nr:hypothetical protein [Bacteroidota bacterium]|tara:strand:+ start:1516 stop:1731 length:216 start_codon:yes stop_codon:yes gene_type:complete